MTNAVLSISPLARAAVRYAQHGWHVFPLIPRDKHPLIAKGGGFLSATADVDAVSEWWRANPSANIGLWPGQSGLVVIDLDGPEGEQNAAALGILEHRTLECRTGRDDGGRHLYFKRPDFSVSNGKIGKKIDVRGDAGYVILPPSIHPTGRRYEWNGRVEEIQELPAAVVELLQRAQIASVENARVGGDGPARDIAFEESIDQGGRNNTLTRYAGRLLAKGHELDEVLVIVSALNEKKCKPPLPQHEINVMVSGLAAREAKKNAPVSGLAVDVDQPRRPLATIRTEQIARARALLSRDVSQAPRWAWRDVDALTGPMMPGELVTVGARTNNGKSTLLMSQMDAFAAAKTSVLYVPLEIDPEVNRLRWAAWKLQLDVRYAIQQNWSKLPEGAQEAIDGVIEEQEHDPHINFVDDRRVTMSNLFAACRQGREESDCKVIMLDHFHRMEFGDAKNHRVNATEVARDLKDMARELGVVMVAAGQLNQSSDPLDKAIPPQLSRLKETAGLAEESDVVLMLSRRPKHDLPQHWRNDLMLSRINERDLIEPGVMVVTCRKHRLDDDAIDKSVFVTVFNGRLQDRLRPGEMPPRQIDAAADWFDRSTHA